MVLKKKILAEKNCALFFSVCQILELKGESC